MKVPWTARRSNHSVLKEISPEYSLEGLMLKLKLQYFGYLMGRTDSLENDPDAVRVFFKESVLRIRWPKYWRFSFSISPSNEYSGLISFRTDWLDLLAVQGTLKSLLQHHNSRVSILWCSAFFKVQLSHPYMTTGKTIALTRQTFVGKVILIYCLGWS